MTQDEIIRKPTDMDFHEWLDWKLEQVRLTEREACAKVCDSNITAGLDYQPWDEACSFCADAIRDRKNK